LIIVNGIYVKMSRLGDIGNPPKSKTIGNGDD